MELGELMEQQRVAFPDEDTPHIITVLSTALLLAGKARGMATPAQSPTLSPHAASLARAHSRTGTHRIGASGEGLDVLFVPVPDCHGLQRTSCGLAG